MTEMTAVDERTTVPMVVADAESPSPDTGPELIFGFVAPVGSDLDRLTRAKSIALNAVKYSCVEIRLSSLLTYIDRPQALRETPRDARYQDYMDAGDELRRKTKQLDAMAVLGAREIVEKRKGKTGAADTARLRTAYLLRSLKTPEEVETLRSIYGGGFFVIAAYSSLEERRERLVTDIALSYGEGAKDEHAQMADVIITRDENDDNDMFGQHVRDTFPLADLFVDLGENDDALRAAVTRFVELMFGFEFHTPTRDENGMFHARSAALRSAELGRQVGAAITTAAGDLVAVGGNELPTAGGGQVWAEDLVGRADPRDWSRGMDQNDDMKRQNLKDVLRILKDRRLLSEELSKLDDDALLETCTPFMVSTRMMNATEFGRAVHAEMSAITSAANRGISVHAHTLYTTTFPCHNCARHVISSGIRRVVYVEPYPKSLARSFHQEALKLDAQRMTREDRVADTWLVDSDCRVRFEPFVGIAPRIYIPLFGMVKRKRGGQMIQWSADVAVPRTYLVPPHLSYFARESWRAEKLLIAMSGN